MVFDFSLISLRIALQAIQYLGKYFWRQLGVGELAQVVERSLSMWEVPGSIPGFSISSSIFHALWKLRSDWYNQCGWYCGELAQVVERSLCMWEVPGSIPGFSADYLFIFTRFFANCFAGNWISVLQVFSKAVGGLADGCCRFVERCIFQIDGFWLFIDFFENCFASNSISRQVFLKAAGRGGISSSGRALA